MVQPNEVVDVVTFFDEWTRCCSSSYQKDRLYRFGTFDSCSTQYQDLKMAFRAKLQSDAKVATAMIQETHYKKGLSVSPTGGHIWALKKTPGWDLEEEESS